MDGFFVGMISIPSLLAAFLLFRSLYKKYYGLSVSKVILLGGFLLFMAYGVFQIALNIYLLDELERSILGLCTGGLLAIGFLLIFATNEKFSISGDFHTSLNRNILVASWVAFVVVLILPPYVAASIENYCANEHKLVANRIIDAVNSYRTSENKIPDNLDLLIPIYLKEIPSPKCFTVYHPFIPVLTDTNFLRSMNYSVMMNLIKLRELDYNLKKCEWGEDDIYSIDLFLIVPTIDLNSKDRYEFFTDSWRKIPYYDDECLAPSS